VNKKADILFVGASVPENAEFNTKVLTKIGGTQVPTCAPQAYDAARTVLMALKENKGIGADLAGTIRSIHFTGISGPIQFDQNGDMTSAVYSVKRIQDGKTVEVK
jgi:ABC-type branched-subunit amino acid transport system substrate-binding protein